VRLTAGMPLAETLTVIGSGESGWGGKRCASAP
jgi:hypothetical protein